MIAPHLRELIDGYKANLKDFENRGAYREEDSNGPCGTVDTTQAETNVAKGGPINTLR